VEGLPYTCQFSDTQGRREIVDCHGKPEVVRAVLAGFLYEAKQGDFLLGGFFYFRFDIQVLFRDKPEVFEGLGNVDFVDEHKVHWKGSTQWPVIFLIGRYEGRTLLVIDTWRFFPGSLERVCYDLQLPFKKMEKPPCIAENRAPTEAERPYFNEYAQADSDANLEILTRIDSLWARDSLGPCISVAHLSGKKFRRDFTGGLGLDVPDEFTSLGGLLAYKGGRNSLCAEKLPLVVDACKMFDVRSLYPYICSELLPSFFGGCWVWRQNPTLVSAGVYRLKGNLEIGNCAPYRLLMDAKGDYLKPGPIDCWQTGFEIIAAMKHGLLKDFQIQGAVWEPGDQKRHPFKEFYGEVFNLKEENRGKNVLLYTYYKNIANCLTGKFVSTIPLEVEENGQLHRIRVPGLLFNPPVGALITGAGRALLFEYELSSGSIHGATDSMVVPPMGTCPAEGEKLGDWELAAQGRFVCARNKLYVFLGPKGAKRPANFTGWAEDKPGKKTPYWKGQEVRKYALHAFKGNVFQFLDAVFDGQASYKYTRMVQVRESRKRKNLKPLQMNDFVEQLKLGGKYYTPKGVSSVE